MYVQIMHSCPIFFLFFPTFSEVAELFISQQLACLLCVQLIPRGCGIVMVRSGKLYSDYILKCILKFKCEIRLLISFLLRRPL